MSALAQLRSFNRSFAGRCSVRRWFAASFHVEVENHLIDDVAAEHSKIVATTHKAETYDREALSAMDAATDPKSEGGVNITPAEAKRIRPFIAKSAELDHDASELAHV